MIIDQLRKASLYENYYVCKDEDSCLSSQDEYYKPVKIILEKQQNFRESYDSYQANDIYEKVSTVVGVLVFIGCWIYSIFNFGWFLGISLGWIPSLIIAFFAAILWPIIGFGVIVLLVLVIAVVAYFSLK